MLPRLAEAADVAGHPLWHLAAVVVAPVVIILAFTLYDRVRYGSSVSARGKPSAAAPSRAPTWPGDDGVPARLDARLLPIAAAAAGAGVVHALVCPEHFEEATVYGLFFLAVSPLQLAWAVAILRRPSRALLAVGAIANALVIALWLDTRTFGLPLGPHRFQPEEVGRLDLLATALEAIAVVLVLRLRHRRTYDRGAARSPRS